MTLSVVILAAGKGSRMFSEKPKVLHELSNQPLLQYVINAAKNLKPVNINVVIGYKSELVEQEFSKEDINWIVQKEQLGTGDAVKYTTPFMEGAQTMVLYGDVPLIDHNDLKKLLQVSKDGLGILTFDKKHPKGYGRIKRTEDKVEGIIEEKDCSETEKKITEINTGIMCIDTIKLNSWLTQITNHNSQKEYYLTDIVALAKKDNTKIVTHEAKDEHTILGINTKAELVAMEKILKQKKNTELIKQGVTIIDSSRTEIRGSLVCGSDVEIDVGCIFEGEVELGNNVKVGAYSHIKDSNILDNANIKPYSHIDSSEVGINNNIGPYARLRPGAKTKSNVNIGNFVEIKNSTIGEGSKINHLSYVGDSQVGENVNIGAGCITCNYDGVNKHKTIIEDDVFIGSNSQLIAPLIIRAGSTIGAGSTITKDTPANQLSLARSKQTNIPSWERPKKK